MQKPRGEDGSFSRQAVALADHGIFYTSSRSAGTWLVPPDLAIPAALLIGPAKKCSCPEDSSPARRRHDTHIEGLALVSPESQPEYLLAVASAKSISPWGPSLSVRPIYTAGS
jgi:hypothetical protein